MGLEGRTFQESLPGGARKLEPQYLELSWRSQQATQLQLQKAAPGPSPNASVGLFESELTEDEHPHNGSHCFGNFEARPASPTVQSHFHANNTQSTESPPGQQYRMLQPLRENVDGVTGSAPK